MDVLNLHELEALAKAKLPQMAWDYYASGADDERCLRRNLEAYEAILLHYHVLVDVARRELATTVLGERIAMPIAVAPTAFHRLAHPDGELASVRGAGDAGTLFILSTLSNTPVEDVVAAASGPVWFQLYVYRDRAATAALVQRVEAAGCRALVLTVDAPLLGRRERDVRNRFGLPPELGVSNLHAAGYAPVPAAGGESGLAAYFATLLDPALTWDVLPWLRSITKLPIVVKGIVRADDAVRAVTHGAAGIVVSNHGGRQLDASPATIDVLPRIVDAVAGRGEILLDGGVRRGTDVVKALALGARAVLVGRPVLWGLTAGGREGVAAALGVLRRELDLAMALCGCADLGAITRDLVTP
ncbi:MAG: alpha-hydroxy-acid oxidizing protein [Myxococcales bacterium]|nr:alpha-hydroxy-acid oxidizing protein [Myxococcales bacterium]